MFTLNTELTDKLETSGAAPSYCLELRPRRSLPDVNLLKLDIDFESAACGNILPNSEQEESASVGTTYFARGNSRAFSVRFDDLVSDSRINLADGIKIDGTSSLSETFVVAVSFKQSSNNIDSALFGLFTSASAGNQRRFEIGITDDYKIYGYVNGVYGETSANADVLVISTWHHLIVSYTTLGLGADSQMTIYVDNNSLGTISFTAAQVSDGGNTYADGVLETIVGAAKVNNTDYNNNFYGWIEKVLLWDNYVDFDSSSRAAIKEYFSPSIKIYQSDSLFPNSISSISSIDGGINGQTRVYTSNDLELILSDDSLLRDLNVNYELRSVAYSLFLGFSDIDDDNWQIVAAGMLADSYPVNDGSIKLLLSELRLPTESENDFLTYYIGHPAEVIEEMFKNFKIPRNFYNKASFAWDANTNFSHYNTARTVKSVNVKADTWLNSSRTVNRFEVFFGKTQSPTAIVNLINDLNQFTHSTIRLDQFRKFYFQFYDPTDTSVKTLTNDDVLSIEQTSTVQNTINQIHCSGGQYTLGPNVGDLPALIFDVTANVEASQEALALPTGHKNVLRGPDMQTIWNNAAGQIYIDLGSLSVPATALAILSPGFCGFALSPSQRVLNGTQESDRTISASRPLYLACFYTKASDYIQRETTAEAEIIKIETLAAHTGYSFPEWSQYELTNRAVIGPDGIRTVQAEYFPAPSVNVIDATVTERQIFGTGPYDSSRQDIRVLDVTTVVNSIQFLLNRYAYGAPTFTIELPLRYLYLEEGDIIKLDTEIGLTRGIDGITTDSNFEIMSKKINGNKITLDIEWRNND